MIMPNWCSTAYAIEGNAKELKKLYDLMNGLQERKEPSVPNGFGTAWLGCLVDAFGGNWKEVFCRGNWYNLQFDGNVLTFNTETAWSPCNDVFDMVCEKYSALRYFYQSEEPGMGLYCTNDEDGKYFPDRFYVDVCISEEEYNTSKLTSWAFLRAIFSASCSVAPKFFGANAISFKTVSSNSWASGN